MNLATRCRPNGCEIFALLNTLTYTNKMIFSHLQSATMDLDILQVRYKQLKQLAIANRDPAIRYGVSLDWR